MTAATDVTHLVEGILSVVVASGCVTEANAAHACAVTRGEIMSLLTAPQRDQERTIVLNSIRDEELNHVLGTVILNCITKIRGESIA